MSDTENIKMLPTVYDPTGVEKKWYEYWLEKNYFHASVDNDKPTYCITIPPPNVTGSLHIGHALCYSIQDVLIRWKRMQGYNTLCLPGTDHAGIATQNKVEQQIAEDGLTRHDLGRDEFLKKVWAWKEIYGGQILHQFKTMGFSFDWERERFTMDELYSDAVLESFVRLFNKGYIYRGARVINWCPRCHTAISDIEVEYADHDSHLWHLRYPLEDGSGHIIVATTRPETMLGDTAITVNPKDERYTNLVGKRVILPLTNRTIPIIADDYVDMEFGSGAVKTTPAHDPNDFEIGLRHNLPQIIVIGIDGSMTPEAGEKYAGLDRYDARKQVIADLKELGLLEKIEDYSHSVGACERCHTVIEPLLSEQWFCKMSELAKPATEVVREGKVKFYPDRYTRTYIDWMENIRDWCISRQLWWGHRIPIYKCDDCNEYTASKTTVENCPLCGSSNVTQDPDVLDTWFSSALWPFATLGWPNETPELKKFYPTDVLVTAQEIIYLWVARMIFSSLEYLDGSIPFKDVYIYATVLNEEGRRMSKSLGTGVDPLGLIEKFGTDALRFALIQQAGKNQDIRFSDHRVESVRNFGNKIWNASRFVIMNLEGFNKDTQIDTAKLQTEDKWILSRLQGVINTVNSSFETYDMDDASRALYEFLWNEFCDWYLELAKPRLKKTFVEEDLNSISPCSSDKADDKVSIPSRWSQSPGITPKELIKNMNIIGIDNNRSQVQAVLYYVLDSILRLLHPIMPFITEEIWQALPHVGDSIMVAEYPKVNSAYLYPEAEEAMNLRMDVIRTVRNLRAQIQGVPPSTKANVLISTDSSKQAILEENADSWKILARVNELSFVDSVSEDKLNNYMTDSIIGVDIYLEVSGLIDVDKETARIDSELKSIEKELARVNGKLSSESFISKAPEAIVEKERRIQSELLEKKAKLEERKSRLVA